MWQSFLAGWAWSLASLGPSVPVLDCQCSCKCEVSPCPESTWFWEVVKGCCWILVGVITQLLNLIPLVFSVVRSSIDIRDQKAVERARVEDVQSENPVAVAERARDQLQLLRSRSQRHGSS